MVLECEDAKLEDKPDAPDTTKSAIGSKNEKREKKTELRRTSTLSFPSHLSLLLNTKLIHTPLPKLHILHPMIHAWTVKVSFLDH